jgi:predicted glycosyltransferase
MDFEHQPANHLAFRLADRVLLPGPLPTSHVRRQGAGPGKVTHYPGLKEELYLGDFEPNGAVLKELGLDRSRGPIVVTRTPPTRALYRGRSNPLYMDVLTAIAGMEHVQCVAFPRHPEQRAELGLHRFVVPDRAVNARSLMYAADLVIGAGGTMTREAALLGVPTFSVFAGSRPSVDRWLEGRGLLARLVSTDQVRTIRRRAREPAGIDELRRRGSDLVDSFADAVVAVYG